MPGHNIVVIGASSGGLEALRTLAHDLPEDFAASIFVVVHIAPHSTGVIAQVLAKAGPLTAATATDEAPIVPGRIYVAAPDHHLLLSPGRVRVVKGPKENNQRPAIDPLFRSAASAYDGRVIGVILSGALDDGTAGLWTIKSAGGITIVQDPSDAQHPGMPSSALAYVKPDHVLPLAQIGPKLVEILKQPAPPRKAPPKETEVELDFARQDAGMVEIKPLGQPTAYSCPTCHGTLWELRDGALIRFRCHTGHAFSPETLGASQDESTEIALYEALRALQEQGAACRRLADFYGKRHPDLRQRNVEKSERCDRSAGVLRELLRGGGLTR